MSLTNTMVSPTVAFIIRAETQRNSKLLFQNYIMYYVHKIHSENNVIATYYLSLEFVWIAIYDFVSIAYINIYILRSVYMHIEPILITW